jgi:thioesterase domain-containing protein
LRERSGRHNVREVLAEAREGSFKTGGAHAMFIDRLAQPAKDTPRPAHTRTSTHPDKSITPAKALDTAPEQSGAQAGSMPHPTWPRPRRHPSTLQPEPHWPAARSSRSQQQRPSANSPADRRPPA